MTSEQDNRFLFYLQRHNDYVEKLANKLKGETYRTAPFDITTADGQFYEVKVTKTLLRHRGHYKWTIVRFWISRDELKFMTLVKKAFHVILILADESVRAFLIEPEQIASWVHGDFCIGFRGQRKKIVALGKRRLATLATFSID